MALAGWEPHRLPSQELGPAGPSCQMKSLCGLQAEGRQGSLSGIRLFELDCSAVTRPLHAEGRGRWMAECHDLIAKKSLLVTGLMGRSPFLSHFRHVHVLQLVPG